MAKKFEYGLNSFFSGIGGFELGFERNGFETLMQCEVNKFCQQVLKTQWNNVKLFTDINTITPSEIPKADIWCGGFPCQDVSVARVQKDEKVYRVKIQVYFSICKANRSKKPTMLLIENVTGLLSSHNGQDFRIVLETLSDMGYAIAWRVINSRYFGTPQSRPRVFICAALKNPYLAVSSIYEFQKA